MKLYIKIIALMLTAVCLQGCQEAPVKQRKITSVSVFYKKRLIFLLVKMNLGEKVYCQA